MKWGLAALTVAITAVAFAAPAGAAKPPPGTVIDTGPAAVTAATTAMFTFHATKATATFSCRMDGASFTACTSPTTVTGVTPGAHTFSVYATGNSGSDPTPATLTWSVDQTNPTEPTGLSATPAGPTSMALRWTAGTDNASIAGNDIARDGTVVATIGAVTSWTDTSVAAASTHTYTVVSIDAAGNKSPPSQPATATTPATPTPPDTIVDTAPPALTNASSATVTFHATTPGATFTCILDSGKANSCTSPRTYTGLSSGSHTFTVRATANSLTDPTPAQASWTVDTIAPSVPTGLATTTADSAVTLTWTASTDVNGVAGYDVYRGGTLLQSVAATTTYTDSTVTPGRLYSYAVRAKDAAGNTSALSPAVTATASAAYDPHLTRAPYLTDLVNLNVAINFATDRSDTTGSAQYGAVNPDGSCIPTTSVAAIRSSVLVGTVSEYQWKVPLTLPATGSYCYRVYLGPIDLLAGNASPVFTTQAQPGSTESYSFDVLGDWGMVDATGQNPGQAALMTQIAASGARFAVTVGDNGYPNGSQINYGDLQQSGAGTSAIFGAQMWPVPGQSIPIFTAVGNHGLAGTAHADITNWPQDVTVATSGGRYQNDVYCCVNGSVSSNYGSEWYAFTAGNTRFYVLDSAWGDTNGGTASPYANDALAHFAPGTPEYQWLVNDLQTHPTQLKFAFSHYPLYVDNPSEFSDSFLQGASNLEGLLGQHGVQIVFNGHAHLYERNAASAAGMPITYVTGGGGATLEPIGPCSAFDSYGIGWSPSRQAGSACGRASTPTSDSQVYHFLKVTVSGTSVTVSPTDSTGRVFDRQTYTFKVPTDTYLDAQPPAGRTSSTATFAFHGSGTPATFVCSLDGAIATTCTSPTTYTNLAEGRHVFTVAARVGKSMDPTPATAQWTVDTTAPTSPTSVTTNTTSPFSVDVSWTGATDNTGVRAYHVARDGVMVATVTTGSDYIDWTAQANTTYSYSVSAVDVAGNESGATTAAPVTTGKAPNPVFADGFESGDLSAWTTTHGLTVQGATVHTGAQAAEGNTTTGAAYARKTLPASYPDVYARVAFDVVAQPDQVNLLRLRDPAGASLGYAYIETTGQLGYHNDALGTNTLSGVAPSAGWHVLELHRAADAAGTSTGALELWLDGAPVTDLSDTSLDVGAAPVGGVQIGETQTGQTYDVVFDDVAVGTSRLGTAADTTAPDVPTGLSATATAPFSADLTWTASSDDVAVTGYDVTRDGVVVASLGAVTAWTDSGTVAGSDHTYTVRARDAAGNVSAWSAPATVTQPPAAVPVFSDGFETGDLSAWTTTSNLGVQTADVRSGSYAAQANVTAAPGYAKRTLPATYTDAYSRVAFNAASMGTQVTLLRLRDTPTGNGGYVYLSATGRLAFRSDALMAGTVSGVAPGPGWHALELHLAIDTTTSTSGRVEVWLDGAPVPALTISGIDLGTAPVGVLQIGDTAVATADIRFDDAAFSTTRLGPAGDTSAPTAPDSLTATANSPFDVGLAWNASTDDVGVTRYDVYRDGTLLATLPGAATTYDDPTVAASTGYGYTVRARDAAGNVSPSAIATVTTPAPAAPVWSNGFETGDLTGWTTTAGLTVESTDVNTGAFAAEGSTTVGNTFAKKTLPATYTDAYAQVAFEIKSQPGQVNLLRLRTSAGGSIAFLYVNTSGKLGLHIDGNPSTEIVSGVLPGTGWHTLQLHADITGGNTEVWLDGTKVPALSLSGVNLGVAPVGAMQIGDATPARTYDVVFDDAAFSTSRL